MVVMKIIPVVLCGGAGSRLWPVSRELHPKPFIRLEDGQSLLQKAFLRAAALSGVQEVVIVTNRELFFKIEDELQEVNAAGLSTFFILEPFGRNTAAAVAAAALVINRIYGEEAVMLVLAADHLIADQDAFAAAVGKAVALAQQGDLVTFGIQPRAPETGYGYIEAEGNRVLQFVEKPPLEKAREYVASGRFLWNSGMFCFTAGAVLREMQDLRPDILSAAAQCIERSRMVGSNGFARLNLDGESLAQVPESSIDCAIMEKSDRVAVVPCDIGWSDIGSWSALSDLVAADEAGNRTRGEALLHDVSNCYVHSDGRLIGALGVDNLIIVDTPDALLVADRARSQDVQKIYSILKTRGHESYKLHRVVHRPWGTYTVLEEGDRFKIKRIEVKPGGSLSLQMHLHRSEHWIVVRGMAKVVNGEKELLVNANESTFIPAGHRHRLENPGKVELVMIEVQSGEYLGEDDITRFEDKYDRVDW